MKKKAAIIFTAVFLIVTVIMYDGNSTVPASSFKADSISAQAAVLMCADTGEVLFSLKKDESLPMASTTKIMTALIALEDPSPMREIKVTKEMVTVEGTSMGLLPDDTVSLYTLAAGMLLQSGNDAANVTAYAIAGGLDEFSKLMNKKAKEIGMRNTNFVTPRDLTPKSTIPPLTTWRCWVLRPLKTPFSVKSAPRRACVWSTATPRTPEAYITTTDCSAPTRAQSA